MFILGLQGSPRAKSNTHFLLSAFMDAAKKRGAETRTLEICRMNIKPCEEYVVCEKKGFCPIDDDMKHEVYPLLRRADVVVAATPIFFYNTTAQLKALIDRSQTLWARKYRLNLKDPGNSMRKGFLLAVGATRGKQLFDGVHLTAKYFFDAVAASYDGSLTYWEIEHKTDMAKHPTVNEDVEAAVEGLLQPFIGRRKVLFASRYNACRSQMAAAFARHLAGDKIEAMCGGTEPAVDMNPMMVEAMAEVGVDMMFRRPMSIQSALAEGQPDLVMTMGSETGVDGVSDTPVTAWQLPGLDAAGMDDMRRVREDIKEKVLAISG